MNDVVMNLSGERLVPLPSGAMFWAAEHLLCVSDLHFGKSDRIARLGGTMLPPYETRDTLTRLAADLDATGARTVICLGDSFDDCRAANCLSDEDNQELLRLQAGRRWIWIEGNHDPGPIGVGGAHRQELRMGPLLFRHIAQCGASGEVSGHYHPKADLLAKGRKVSRRCFLWDTHRLIMPAYGTYTGGLSWSASPLQRLMGPGACAALIGPKVRAVPMPRHAEVAE